MKLNYKKYKTTEVGLIPNDWDCKTLNNFLELLTDYDANGSFSDIGSNTTIFDSENFAWYVRATDLEKQSDISCVKYVDEKTYKYLKKSKLFGGEVLITKRGEIGKVYFFEMKTNFATLAPNLYLLKLNDLINPFYLFSFFKSSIGQKSLIEKNASTTLGALYKDDVKSIFIPIPPTKTEQILIATALSDADALITNLEKLIEKKRAIKEGAIQQLLKPKEGWEEKNYGEVFTFLATATYSRAELLENDDVHYIHYGDIHTKWNIFLDFNKSNLPTVNIEQAKNFAFLKEGDIVMADASEDYSGVGKSVEVKNIRSLKVIAGLHTFLLRDKNKIFVNGFRGYIHLSKLVKNQFDRLATGLKVYGVSKGNLKTVTISFPSKDEQKQITTILSDMEAEIIELEIKLEKYRSVKVGMIQNLLTGRIRLI